MKTKHNQNYDILKLNLNYCFKNENKNIYIFTK